MSSKPEPLHRARIAVRREILDDLFDVFADMDPAPTSWEDMETGDAWVETCDLDLAVLHRRAREMADRLQAYDGRVHAAEITTLPPEEWTEAWKRFFHVARVSPRLVIHPVWEPIDPAPSDIVIDIDPGMSFGTGLHPTTRSCLRLLDERASSAPLGSFLDLGCGSGILSIAAVKLGAAPVAALDYDPDAVAVARENLALNGIDPGAVTLSAADVTRDPLPRARIVVANILASVLIDAAERLAATVEPDGELILSGILDTQFDAVAAAYAAQGLRLSERLPDTDWSTGRFVHA